MYKFLLHYSRTCDFQDSREALDALEQLEYLGRLDWAVLMASLDLQEDRAAREQLVQAVSLDSPVGLDDQERLGSLGDQVGTVSLGGQESEVQGVSENV